jgi:hypothetical protein
MLEKGIWKRDSRFCRLHLNVSRVRRYTCLAARRTQMGRSRLEREREIVKGRKRDGLTPHFLRRINHSRLEPITHPRSSILRFLLPISSGMTIPIGIPQLILPRVGVYWFREVQGHDWIVYSNKYRVGEYE